MPSTTEANHPIPSPEVRWILFFTASCIKRAYLKSRPRSSIARNVPDSLQVLPRSVLSHALEPKYLEAAPQPLRDLAILILETGVRPGEAANLPWKDVYLHPAVHAKFGYIAIRQGKSKNAKRNLSLTARGAKMLKARRADVKSPWVFPGDSPDAAILVTSLDHQHEQGPCYAETADGICCAFATPHDADAAR